MCLGVPMRVISDDGFRAVVERRGEMRQVSTLLVGPQAPGALVLVHVDTAVRILDAEEARRIDDALDGVAAALEGRDFEHLFADLVDRTPQLPAFLAPASATIRSDATSTSSDEVAG